jgi:glycosyltransferase involved in cell wall biosynthesis
MTTDTPAAMHASQTGAGLRILFVNSGLRFGGAETQLIATMRELKRQGHHPSLYLLTEDAPRLSELTDAGIPVQIDQKRLRLDFAVLWRLQQHIRRLKPALVHGYLFDANIYSRISTIGLAIPVLNSERNHGYQLRLAQSVIHWPTRALADGVVANSHAGRVFAQNMFGLPAQRTHTVWNGVDTGALDARVAASKDDYRQSFFGDSAVKLAVLVGTITSQKDHLLAIAVAEHLFAIDPRWRVAFIGASYDESQLGYKTQTTKASNVLGHQVHDRWRQSPQRERMAFIGQRRDAVEIIAAADVLFSTSRHEGFPNVVLEAMTVGTPVVSTSYSDIDQILPARLVVRDRNPLALAQAIAAAALEGPALGHELRSWVDANATIEISVRALLRVYSAYIKAGQESGN